MPETAEKMQAEIKEPEKPYKFGRPTLYKPQICHDLIQYFAQEPYYTEEIPHYSKGEVSWVEKKRVPNPIPTLTSFCKQNKLGWSTVHEWINPNKGNYRPDFADAYAHARALRKDFLLNGAILAGYQPNTFKFIATNLTDMTDRQEVEHNVKDSIAGLIQAASQENARKRVESKEVDKKPALNAVNPKTAG